MIEVKSYLRSADGKFTLVNDVVTPPSNNRHVEGAIELIVNSVPIIDKSFWDDVDQLWYYIVNMIIEICGSDTVETYFPDMPVKLILENTGRNLIGITLLAGEERRKAVVDKAEFMNEVKRGAIEFFRAMSHLIPENRHKYQLFIQRAGG